MTRNLQSVCKAVVLMLIAENCLPPLEGREHEASDFTTSPEDKQMLLAHGVFLPMLLI